MMDSNHNLGVEVNEYEAWRTAFSPKQLLETITFENWELQKHVRQYITQL
jgi:hypothetical protein